jgi:sec-independent protein translocase protein TatA
MDLFAPTHLLILLAIILVLFGPSKLGDISGTLGKSIHDFKKAMSEPDTSGPPTPAAAEVKGADQQCDSQQTASAVGRRFVR